MCCIGLSLAFLSDNACIDFLLPLQTEILPVVVVNSLWFSVYAAALWSKDKNRTLYANWETADDLTDSLSTNDDLFWFEHDVTWWHQWRASNYRLSMSLSHGLLKQVGEGFVTNVLLFLWSSQKWPNKLLQGKVSILLARLLLPGELVALASAHRPADIVPLKGDWTPWLGHLPPSDTYCPVVLGRGVRGHLKGLQAEKEIVAPSLHQVGEVWVETGWGKVPGLLESVRKSLILLNKGKIKIDAQDMMGLCWPPWAAIGTDVLCGDKKWYKSLSGSYWPSTELPEVHLNS